MAKQKSPTFPFFYRDWLHGVKYYKATEKVSYLELLCEQADSKTGSIEPEIFNHLCKSETVRSNFLKDKNGFFNERMRDVLDKRNKFKESRLANLNGSHMEPHMEPHMEKEKEKEVKKVKTSEPIRWPWMEETFINQWQVWKDYKKDEHRFTYKTTRSEQTALENLYSDAGGNLAVAIQIIKKSIGNGYKGLFPLKNNQAAPVAPQRPTRKVLK
jgi:hypothetical protein